MTMNGNQNHDDDFASSSSTKRVKTRDNDGAAPWSNLNDDVLFLVMMQLGVFDFLPFSRVCKSWRSFAVSNKNIFMASRPPMFISISRDHAISKNYCHLQDFEGRKLETILPLSTCLTFFGLSCGYLILFGNARHDFWLVNPITGHQLHFPSCPMYGSARAHPDRGILVFSRSISRWVFAISKRFSNTISYHTEGKRGWTNYISTLRVLDLYALKGKIYILHSDCRVSEMRVNPYPKLTLLKTKSFPKAYMRSPVFVSSGENLYVMDGSYLSQNENQNRVLPLDFGEMKWVSPEKTIGNYAFFISKYAYSSAIKPESWAWADHRTLCKINDYFHHENFCNPIETRPGVFYYGDMWYFPLDFFESQSCRLVRTGQHSYLCFL